MSEVNVVATRWKGGWELEIDKDHHTQVVTLDHARQQVIDYLDTVDESVDHSGWKINIVPEIASWTLVVSAKDATRDAASAQKEAAELSRRAARQLREDGFSVTDSAAIMGISRGRVSQLVRG